MSADAHEQQFHFSCPKAVLDRLQMERIEMIYMVAFRSLFQPGYEEQAVHLKPLLFRFGSWALIDLRINQNW
ncbi:MAG: hypothetical protein RLY14_3210 [Planctomycetota bacterium]|jgi:hypothetical protein